MPKRTTRTIPRLRSTILRVTELERRDTPAWWTVTAPVPAQGTLGVTDATHAGSLALNPDYAPANGAATVWADTAALAVTKALTGKMSVALSGQTVEHAFGPATVGATAADHKAYLAVVTGTSVALAFEDMAGQPGCDYDYNDRSWSGVSVAAAAGGTPTVLDSLQATWTRTDGGPPAETLDVTSTVTYDAPGLAGLYKWGYHVANNSFGLASQRGEGGAFFDIPVPGQSGVGNVQNSMGWDWRFSQVYVDGVSQHMLTWADPGQSEPIFLLPGESADFSFTTQPTSVARPRGVAASEIYAYVAVGFAIAPGLATADITIDGDLTVGATNPDIPGSKPVVTEFSPKNNTNEDVIGGLVVRNADSGNGDDNKAPRQQITIQKLKDAAGNPAVGGQVTLTVPGEVKLFDAATKGNLVATGRVFDQKALPKKLWVEGAVGSSTMRDAKIKAEPAGNVAGADDVSFTVLWVDVVVATDGKLSANNDKRQKKRI